MKARKVHKFFEILTTLSIATALVACGGGGGGSSSDNSISAEGVWSGSSSSGYNFDLLVLENGDLYSIYGTLSGGVLLVRGFDQGSSKMTGSTLNANITEYDYSGTSTGTVTAKVVTGTSLNGSAINSSGTSTVTFTSSPLSTAAATYNYNTAPVISDVLGNWVGTVLDGSAATVSISAAGGITGNNQGCTFTGTASPRSSGKNIFNMTLTFGPSPCTYPGQKVSGIALDYLLSSGKRQLLAAMQDSTKAHGYMFFAQR